MEMEQRTYAEGERGDERKIDENKSKCQKAVHQDVAKKPEKKNALQMKHYLGHLEGERKVSGPSNVSTKKKETGGTRTSGFFPRGNEKAVTCPLKKKPPKKRRKARRRKENSTNKRHS